MKTAKQHNAPQIGFYELLRDEPGADILKTLFEACGHNVVDFTPKKKTNGHKKTNRRHR